MRASRRLMAAANLDKKVGIGTKDQRTDSGLASSTETARPNSLRH